MEPWHLFKIGFAK